MTTYSVQRIVITSREYAEQELERMLDFTQRTHPEWSLVILNPIDSGYMAVWRTHVKVPGA